MSIDQLKRVIWRLQEKGFTSKIPIAELRKVIMYECGTDERTIETNISKLMELGWLKRRTRYSLYIQDEFKNA